MVSRGNGRVVWRPVAVWASVTVGGAGAGLAVPGTWRAAGASAGPGAVADVLVATCATVLALALAWLWTITSVTVAGVLTGRVGTRGGATRRLVLVACGAAVLAGAGAPALAAGGDGPELLVGLALPERAVAPPRVHHAHAPPTTPAIPPDTRSGTYVVRPGDSLWSIARAHPQATTPVDQRWRAIWQANRDVVGDDPDLIIPGQALRLPASHPTQDPHSDGDRR